MLDRISSMRELNYLLDTYLSLATISQAITLEFNLDRLYKIVHTKVTEWMGADLHFAIAIYDARTNMIHLPYYYEGGDIDSIPDFPLGEGLTSLLVKNRKSLMLVQDTEAQAIRMGAKIVGQPAKSWLGVPLMIGGEVVGAIILQDPVKENRFTEHDQVTVEALAPQIAIAIRNAQLVDQMSQTLEAYDKERAFLNSLLDAVPEKISFKDLQGQYNRFSRSFLADSGFENAADILGKSEKDIIPGEDGLRRFAEDMDIITNGVSNLAQTIANTDGNGNSTWELLSKVPIFDDHGKPSGLLAISQDITKIKSAELISQRQAQQLQTASLIARDVTASLETGEILRNATTLICDKFGYYHASVFLIDFQRRLRRTRRGFR